MFEKSERKITDREVWLAAFVACMENEPSTRDGTFRDTEGQPMEKVRWACSRADEVLKACPK